MRATEFIVEGVAEGEVVPLGKKHRGDLDSINLCSRCGGKLEGGTYMGQRIKVCQPCKQVYLPPNSGIDQQGNKIKEQGVAEDLNELTNTSLKVKQPKDFVNTNDRKQVTWKVMKFKSGKDTYLINFTMQDPPTFGKKSKSNWNAVNVAFGVKEPQDEYSFGDEINTDLTARNKNQFLIYSTVINAVRKFITEYNTEIDEIIMQGAGERQQAMYQRFFQSAGKYFPGWHYNGKHSLVRDVPRQTGKKVREQGVTEGIEDNYNKNDAGIKATLQAGVKLIPIQSNNHATGKPIYIHDYSGRYTVLVDMGGISVPYYVSTGLGGKAGVAVDKWYPFFGIGSDGWINKGSEANINDFYGSNKLKRVAQVLNNTLGLPSRAKNVSGWPGNRGDENYFISAVNRGLDPAPRSDHSTKIRDNMLSVLRRLGEPNKYVEKVSPTQAARPKGIVFDKNNPEHVASFNTTSQSERELATALAKEPKGVA